MREARWLIHGLRPPILDEYGVVAAIEELISQSGDENQPAIEFSHKIAFDRLPPSLENTIFRIVQESLNNARRHSQSERYGSGCPNGRMEYASRWRIGASVSIPEKSPKDISGWKASRSGPDCSKERPSSGVHRARGLGSWWSCLCPQAVPAALLRKSIA